MTHISKYVSRVHHKDNFCSRMDFGPYITPKSEKRKKIKLTCILDLQKEKKFLINDQCGVL